MADAPAEAKKGSVTAFRTLMATIGSGLLVFFANVIWQSFEKNTSAIDGLSARVERLESDKAKWELLSELNNRTIALERGQALHENDVEWLRWSLGTRGIVKLDKDPSTQPKLDPFPVPLPIPVPPKEDRPRLVPIPDQKKLSPEDLKKLYEDKHQYPTPDQRKK